VNTKMVRAILAASAASLLTAGLIAAGTAQAATLPKLMLALTRSSITVGGTLQSGGVDVVSTATGTKEATALLFQVKPGVSVAEVYAFLKTPKAAEPNYASKYGAIVFAAEATPGQTSEAQVELQAGQYLALIAEGEGGPKVYSSFTVAAAAAPVPLPTPQATVRSIEFAFRGPSTLHDGELVRFENEGFLVHMDIAFPVKSRKAAQQVVADLLAGKEKGLEKLVAGAPIGFSGPVSSGAFQQETITAKPGWYVQACFMDTQDGRDHTRLGMERIIRIVK
jgi:hypothetical protein